MLNGQTLQPNHLAPFFKANLHVWARIQAPMPMSSSSSAVADLVVKNALIFTSDDSLPFADSMAILNRRILRVGTYSSVQVLQTSSLAVLHKIATCARYAGETHFELELGDLSLVLYEFSAVFELTFYLNFCFTPFHIRHCRKFYSF